MNAALPFEKMIYSSLSEQVSINRIKSMMENREKWQWLSYAFIPLVESTPKSILNKMALMHCY